MVTILGVPLQKNRNIMGNTIDWTKYEQASEEEKVSLLKSWAEQGDVESQFKLGVRYLDGDGVGQVFFDFRAPSPQF